jgi:hypothetical protein
MDTADEGVAGGVMSGTSAFGGGLNLSMQHLDSQ